MLFVTSHYYDSNIWQNIVTLDMCSGENLTLAIYTCNIMHVLGENVYSSFEFVTVQDIIMLDVTSLKKCNIKHLCFFVMTARPAPPILICRRQYNVTE